MRATTKLTRRRCVFQCLYENLLQPFHSSPVKNCLRNSGYTLQPEWYKSDPRVLKEWSQSALFLHSIFCTLRWAWFWFFPLFVSSSTFLPCVSFVALSFAPALCLPSKFCFFRWAWFWFFPLLCPAVLFYPVWVLLYLESCLPKKIYSVSTQGKVKLSLHVCIKCV